MYLHSLPIRRSEMKIASIPLRALRIVLKLLALVPNIVTALVTAGERQMQRKTQTPKKVAGAYPAGDMTLEKV